MEFLNWLLGSSKNNKEEPRPVAPEATKKLKVCVVCHSELKFADSILSEIEELPLCGDCRTDPEESIRELRSWGHVINEEKLREKKEIFAQRQKEYEKIKREWELSK